jgi:hypothetical protein
MSRIRTSWTRLRIASRCSFGLECIWIMRPSEQERYRPGARGRFAWQVALL